MIERVDTGDSARLQPWRRLITALGAVSWEGIVLGFGFFAPLIAHTLAALDIAAVWGLSSISIGLVFGGSWGLVTAVRGRWLW